MTPKPAIQLYGDLKPGKWYDAYQAGLLKQQAADLLGERKLPDILVKQSPTFKPLKPFGHR